MGQSLADVLETAGNFMHWLGKYSEANALTLLSRLMRAKGVDDLDQLSKLVELAERDKFGAALTEAERREGGT